ncbi:hypothetical protein [Embleya sp. NPDC050493]|uniref:hypothetical protein n=1 Tax=Embleya sp. NPDC050493 TaxID=3363989 RepID=UPI00378D24E4
MNDDSNTGWRIRTSRIVHDDAGRLAVEICHRTPASHTFRLASDLPDGAVEHEVCCPVCYADRGHILTGTWGHDATLTCTAGHAWTPHPPDLVPADLLREIVRQALGPGRLTHAEARTDPDTTPATPYRDGVAQPLDDAARELNHRTWMFTAPEIHIAADLLRRTDRWPQAITGPEQVTEAARLDRLHHGLAALGEYTRLTGGRLGRLLAACDAVLAPAAALRPDDLEPGPHPGNPPALADPEQAMVQLRVVLRARVPPARSITDPGPRSPRGRRGRVRPGRPGGAGPRRQSRGPGSIGRRRPRRRRVRRPGPPSRRLRVP